MKTNTFRNNQEPLNKSVKPKLNPPKFEEQLIDFTNKNIAWYTSLQKVKFKTFF